jgi:hypothetical protein
MIDKKSCNIHDLVGYKQNIVKIMLEVLYFLIVEHSSKHIATHGHDTSRYKRFNFILLHITITARIYSKIMKFIKRFGLDGVA